MTLGLFLSLSLSVWFVVFDAGCRLGATQSRWTAAYDFADFELNSEMHWMAASKRDRNSKKKRWERKSKGETRKVKIDCHQERRRATNMRNVSSAKRKEEEKQHMREMVLIAVNDIVWNDYPVERCVRLIAANWQLEIAVRMEWANSISIARHSLLVFHSIERWMHQRAAICFNQTYFK